MMENIPIDKKTGEIMLEIPELTNEESNTDITIEDVSMCNALAKLFEYRETFSSTYKFFKLRKLFKEYFKTVEIAERTEASKNMAAITDPEELKESKMWDELNNK